MELRINKDEADKLGLTMLELTYVKLLTLNEAVTIDLDLLASLGYINEDGSPTDLIKNINSPYDPETKFKEIYDLYPHKVPGRALKSISHTSLDYEYCIKKYKILLRKQPDIYKDMLKGLQIELKIRTKDNSEKFQQDIRTWMNNRTWEKYCHLIDDTEPQISKERII